MLELLERGEVTKRHPVPLLFVHGAWHGAWCWDRGFLQFFADRGFHALALSLRGYGNSTTPKPRRSARLSDYVDDVDDIVARLPTRPVLIGHSIGGLVVQKYLESRDSPAAVLMASVPPRGGVGFSLRCLKRDPRQYLKTLATGKSLPLVNTPHRARALFFCSDTPQSDV